MSYWRRYVPVAQRRAKAGRGLKSLLKKGQVPQPVSIEGRTIAQSFWGKAWCDHLESFSDYANRLPRGRTYARNGSVCHLEVSPGRIDAIVSGSMIYKTSVAISPLPRGRWASITKAAAGGIGSMIELLRGEFSHEVMRLVTDPASGLFPEPREIKLHCSCPDWATMCKHVAAVLYGVGNRLDTRPDLLFLLRGVDPQELISTGIALPDQAPNAHAIPDSALSGLFGITLDLETSPKASPRKTGGKMAKAPEKKGAVPSPKPSRKQKPFTGKSVIRLRKKLGLSPAEFAQALGVSLASVQRWEQIPGDVRLKPGSAGALQALLEKSKTTGKQ